MVHFCCFTKCSLVSLKCFCIKYYLYFFILILFLYYFLFVIFIVFWYIFNIFICFFFTYFASIFQLVASVQNF